MQDVSDPDLYNVSVTGLESSNTLVMFVSDGYSPTYFDDNGNGYLPEDLLVPCIGEAFSIPYLTIENYQNVDIVLPSELAKDGNDVGLGTTMFVVAPSDAELTTTVNFYDNTADTGGSPPGSEDNLYLGGTQTYGYDTYGSKDLFPGYIDHPVSGTDAEAALIGYATVVIDVNLGYATPPEAIINDFGTGRFEIGATNATEINAQSTGQTGDGGLIMDLPATYWGSFGATVGGTGENLYFETVPNETGTANLGITVHGSVNDTNLLQGSSGPIYLDHAASVYPVGEDYSYNDAYYGAVGNDTLSGGPFDDNYFPEGGNDTIYLAHASGGSASTIWFGFYDVGYSGQFEDGSGPGAIFEQAITDITTVDPPGAFSGEQFVDGYGTDILTINGFTWGTKGDSIVFGTSDWATKIEVGSQYVVGLTQWDGETTIASLTPDQLHLYTATFDTLGTAANWNGTSGSPNPAGLVSLHTDIVLDNIGGGFPSQSVLQTALTTEGVGDLALPGSGVSGHSTVDMLLAYENTTTHEIDIADITIVNNSSGTYHDTDQAVAANHGSLTVTNLITIENPGLVGIASLGTNPIEFTHA